MSTAAPHLDLTEQDILQEVIGYLNFSSGATEPKFLRNINALFRAIDQRGADADRPVDVLCDWLNRRMDQLQSQSTAFGDVAQARAVVHLLKQHLLPGYRKFHRDLLWHQSDA